MKTLNLIFIILFIFSPKFLFGQVYSVTSAEQKKDSLIISLGENQLILQICSNNILMFNFIAKDRSNDTLPIIERTSWNRSDYKYESDQNEIRINSGELKIILRKNPFQIFISDSKNLLLKGPVDFNFENKSISFETGGKHFYGVTNRQKGDLTFPGKDTIKAGEQGEAGAPFIWTTDGYGLLFNADGGKIILNNGLLKYENHSKNNHNFKLYFFSGSPVNIFTALTDITGKPPLFPKWSMGFLNSEWGIDQDELLYHIQNYHKKDIPIDAFILDFDWMDWGRDNYGEFRWGDKFPDATSGKLNSILESEGVVLAGIRKPRIHLATIQGKYAEEHKFFINYETDYFSKKKVGLLDFYKPEVQKWYWDCFINRGSYSNGITAYWNDEADAYGGSFMFTYMQKSQYLGQRSYNNKRVFSLNRNFYIGNQKYAYCLWSGDIFTGFESMGEQRLFMLSSVILGAGWWSMDIAGFKGMPTDEIYARWMQFGAFVPVYRVHARMNEQRQPWAFNKEAEETAAKYIRLRYELMPYIYSHAWINHNTGISISKPLIFNYPKDENTNNLYSEFLFGDDILVSPIVTRNKSEKLEIYLPSGEWYNFFTEEKYEGNQTIYSSANEKDIPVLIKAGAIIPTQKYGRNVYDTSSTKELIIQCYSGPDNSFTLYEDDGLTYNYEKGEYSITVLNQKTKGNKRSLEISKTKNGYKSKTEYYLIKFKQSKSPKEVLLNNIKIVKKSNDSLHRNEWYYDKEKKVCTVLIDYTDSLSKVTLVY